MAAYPGLDNSLDQNLLIGNFRLKGKLVASKTKATKYNTNAIRNTEERTKLVGELTKWILDSTPTKKNKE